ncbi:XRE family transcriptional regulator [Lactobacillus sp. ESL0236]|uniref:helix-turn-helix domain-containing protein n=1 Tax=unclassified Lactobacillus TaxID=2620435 RepID=UPI000EFA67ED|nr:MULTISPECIES: helix-turn-helix transcriptional regulator [unclassified Lactobacillus]RMC38102.1 XRE family transcriptional regulator [Lactobacillus sp. ESL0237]RMC42645.1 XRE family transcriptional regulator [Lactobacillus sp. ESL0234]RMC43330.1 XRE family transcriptional regulator [Lactobacillus sp. ESL0236]
MNNFGKTIHDLRISRNMTQQELADNLFDRSTISKIEHENLETSYENEVQLISRLGLTLNEFEYISNNYQFSTKNSLLSRFFDLEVSVEIDKVEALLQDCYLIKNDGDIKRIIRILKSILLLNKSHCVNHAKEMVRPIWFDYLSKVQLLTITDISILNTIIYAFDYETADEIISKIITIIDNHYPYKKSLRINTLLNQASIQMLKKKYVLAANNLANLKPGLKDLKQYDKLLVVNARIAVCKRDKLSALEQVTLLHKIGANQLAEGLEQEINEFF